MKKSILFVLILTLMVSVCYSTEVEKKAVKEVIIKAYVQGIKNLGKIEEIKKGFHNDFILFYNRNDTLNKLTLPMWIGIVEKGKKKYPDGLEHKPVVKFHNIDITRNAAVAKFDLTQNKRTSTDYMFLLKFKDGWKIVSKISQWH